MGELIRHQFKSPGNPEKVKDSMLTAYFFLSDLPALLGSRTNLHSYELDDLHKLTLMKQRTSCKCYLLAKLKTCWKYSQTMLS